MSAHPEGSSEGEVPNTSTILTRGKVFLSRKLELGDTSDLQVVKYRLAIGETLLNVVVDSIHCMIMAKDPMVKSKFDDQLELVQINHPDLDFTDREVKAEHKIVINFVSGLVEKFDVLSQWQEAVDRDLNAKVRSNSQDRFATVQRTIDEEMMDKSKDLDHFHMLENFKETMGFFSEQDNPENPLSKLETIFSKFESIKNDLLSNQDFEKSEEDLELKKIIEIIKEKAYDFDEEDKIIIPTDSKKTEILSEALLKVYEKYLKHSKLKALAGERDLKDMLNDMITGTLQAKFNDITLSIKNMSEKLDEQISRKSRDVSMRQSFNNVVIDDGREALNGSYESSKKQTPPKLLTPLTTSPKKQSTSIGVQVSFDNEIQTATQFTQHPGSSNVKLESDKSGGQGDFRGSPEGRDPKPFQTSSPKRTPSKTSEEEQVQSKKEPSNQARSESTDRGKNKTSSKAGDRIDTIPRFHMQYDGSLTLNEIKQKLDDIADQLTTFRVRDNPLVPEESVKTVKIADPKVDSMSDFSEQMADVEKRGVLATRESDMEGFNSRAKVSELFREFIPVVNSFQSQLGILDQKGLTQDRIESQSLSLSKRIIEVFAEFIHPRSKDLKLQAIWNRLHLLLRELADSVIRSHASFLIVMSTVMRYGFLLMKDKSSLKKLIIEGQNIISSMDRLVEDYFSAHFEKIPDLKIYVDFLQEMTQLSGYSKENQDNIIEKLRKKEIQLK